MICQKCGKANDEGAIVCAGCGDKLIKSGTHNVVAASGLIEDAGAPFHMASNAPGTHTTNVNVQVPIVKKNGLGTAGFVLALIGLFTSWVPVLGWIVWFLGAALSVVGIFRVPKGLAIAGTVISFIDLIILVSAIAACSSLTAYLS